MNEVKERIDRFIEGKGFTTNACAKIVGVNESSLRRTDNPTASMLTRILNAFPDLSAEWLMRGKGNMFVPEGSTPLTDEDRAYYEYLVKGKQERIEELEREIARLKMGNKFQTA